MKCISFTKTVFGPLWLSLLNTTSAFPLARFQTAKPHSNTNSPLCKINHFEFLLYKNNCNYIAKAARLVCKYSVMHRVLYLSDDQFSVQFQYIHMSGFSLSGLYFSFKGFILCGILHMQWGPSCWARR